METKIIVTQEKVTLTDKEKQILDYVCQGLTNAEIAEMLSLSSKTIEGYKTKLLNKIKAKNSAHLVMQAAKKGLIAIN